MANFRALSAAGILMLVESIAVPLPAQEPNRPAFEVASIKPAAPAAPGQLLGSPMGFQPGGRFVGRNTSVHNLLIYAYRGNHFTLRPKQIVGGPPWLTSTFFDIEAKVAFDSSAVPIRWVPTGALLLQSLLADRFKLRAHMESRQFDAYVLLPERNDGKLGPSFRPSLVDCQALLQASQNTTPSTPLPSPPAGRPPCGIRRQPGSIIGGGADMPRFTAMLETVASNIVLDRTGLTGNYDIELRWQPTSLTQTTAGDPDGPSLFTALREQLGFKLEMRREPMDVLVIDHIEKPSDN